VIYTHSIREKDTEIEMWLVILRNAVV